MKEPRVKGTGRIQIIGLNPYVLIMAEQVAQLKPGWKKPMPVCVRFAPNKKVWKINLMPVGDGNFYLYLHGDIRRATAPTVGDKIRYELWFDVDYKNGPQHELIPEFAGLAYAGMLITLLVAIASLIVSTIDGILERQKSFATLRLGGMTLQEMKQTVMIESLIPLVSTALLSGGIGCWIGAVFIGSLGSSLSISLQPSYFAIVGGALVLAGLAIYLCLPILARVTSPETNQTE